MKDTTEALIIGMFLSFVFTSIVWFVLLIINHPNADELSCREGKLYEVTHEDNITIYDPTYNECEETK